MSLALPRLKIVLLVLLGVVVLGVGLITVFDAHGYLPLSQWQRLCLFLFGIAAFTAIVVLDVLHDRKTRAAFRNIRDVAQAARAGDLSRRLSFTGADEIDSCSGEVNAMLETLETDLAHLKKLERVRSEFLGNVSHELRTPIFSMQGLIETLLNGAIDDPDVNKEFLEKALRNSDRLSILLNDLIDISRIESGEMKLRFRYFDVGEFLRSSVNEMEAQAQAQGITLTLAMSLEEGAEVYGDRDRLRQVMTNLIENALRYSEEGKTVTVSATDRATAVEIAVEDEGIGIPEEHLSRIFERFYRVDKDRARAGGGTGLGLAIVKHILEAHRTFITVKSEPGKGSVFTFVIGK
jgi:two-component system, OmpR family, phosphate regulon sensor histidine kinase PhoR